MCSAAFDRHADHYDDAFSGNRWARMMRDRTWREMDSLFAPRTRVFDLGCGTGDDAIHAASRGVDVCAVDVSSSMLERVREKAERAGVAERIERRVADFAQLPDDVGMFQGLYSNFGTLNCGGGAEWLPRRAARLLEPGSRVMLVTMSPFYPVEFGAHLARGRFRSASRRWRPNATARVEGVEFPVQYPGIRRLRKTLGPQFRFERSEALHLLVPVPGLDHLDRRLGGLFDRARGVDLWLSRLPPFRTWGDHCLSVWRYEGSR
jgi:ubiquinone/menaquinone biosynthesis C-methylase UbiE